ncbi:MAG: encapsulin [Chthoniobacterales bacterium]
MNGNLGRDRVWNDHIWGEIDQAVREEVGRIRVAQKVFPSTIVNNVLPVSTGALFPLPGPVPDVFEPFLEISREFVLTQAQVDGEEYVRLAPAFARLAASVIGNAEDTVLFFGPTQIAVVLGTGVNVTNQPAALPAGFVNEAANNRPGTPVPRFPGAPRGAPPDILTGIANGMAALLARAQPGPYALFLSPRRYAQTFAPAPGFLQAPGDQINRVVTGGFYAVNCLALIPPPNEIGILVSLGGEPGKIILGSDVMTAFTFTDVQGNYHFRVFERIQMVVRDGRAFETLTF